VATLLYAQDNDTGQTETLEFDAVFTLSPEDPVTITEHPVEVGANITDHARDEPERLTIEAKVSCIPHPKDADVRLSTLELTIKTRTTPGTKTIPLDVAKPPITPSLDGLARAAIGAVSDSILGAPRATVIAESQERSITGSAQAWQQTSPRNRVRDVYERLLGWKTKHLLITVQTTMREYFDMLIERVAAPQTVDDGKAVTFQLDLKRIRVAESETVQSPQPAEARGALGKNKGAQNPKGDKNGDGKAQVYESALSQMTPGG